MAAGNLTATEAIRSDWRATLPIRQTAVYSGRGSRHCYAIICRTRTPIFR